MLTTKTSMKCGNDKVTKWKDKMGKGAKNLKKKALQISQFH